MGARNPKVVRVMMSLNEDVDARLNRVCDRLGQNKGTMAALCSALGLSMIEQLVFASENMVRMAQLMAPGNGDELPFDAEALQTLNAGASGSEQ